MVRYKLDLRYKRRMREEKGGLKIAAYHKPKTYFSRTQTYENVLL